MSAPISNHKLEQNISKIDCSYINAYTSIRSAVSTGTDTWRWYSFSLIPYAAITDNRETSCCACGNLALNGCPENESRL